MDDELDNFWSDYIEGMKEEGDNNPYRFLEMITETLAQELAGCQRFWYAKGLIDSWHEILKGVKSGNSN